MRDNERERERGGRRKRWREKREDDMYIYIEGERKIERE